MTTVYASKVDETAVVLGENFTASENNLLAAYALKEGVSQTQIDKLAKTMNLKPEIDPDTNKKIPVTIRAVQLIAEQRFQHASQILTLFSNLLDKLDQMKQRIIAKFGNT